MAGQDLNPVAGSKIYIGGAIATKATDFVQADFASQTWTEIDGWEQMGAFGDSAQVITSSLINRGRDTKQKGTSNAGSMQNVFSIVPGDAGQAALKAAAAGNNKNNYAFRIVFDDGPPVRSSTATITVAIPGVITWTDHELDVGDAVKFSTTGALPTGLTAGTVYYVKTTPDEDTFTLAATPSGSAIATSGTQSGVHTVTTIPAGSQALFIGLATTSQQAGGNANTIRNMNATIEINSNIVEVDATE